MTKIAFHCTLINGLFELRVSFIFIRIFYQGSHRLEKYLNIQECLEKSLKLHFALKNTQRHLKVLEFYYLQHDSTLSLETLISIKLSCLHLVQHMLHQMKAPHFLY